MQGIPIIYHGTKQGFTGAVDPDNRESLLPHYDTGHWLYVFISTIVKFQMKQGTSLHEAPQVECYVDDEFFAFSRGSVSDVHAVHMHASFCNPLKWYSSAFPLRLLS